MRIASSMRRFYEIKLPGIANRDPLEVPRFGLTGEPDPARPQRHEYLPGLARVEHCAAQASFENTRPRTAPPLVVDLI